MILNWGPNMKALMWWIKQIREEGWQVAWSMYQFTCYCDGCLERPLFRDWSWWLSVNPAPIPIFKVQECSGGWRVFLGWFILWWLKPGRPMRHDKHASKEKENQP